MPAIVLTLGGIFLPDTPNSLVQRGKVEEGRRVLVRIRGIEDVDEELDDIKAAVKQSESVCSPAVQSRSSVDMQTGRCCTMGHACQLQWKCLLRCAAQRECRKP